MNVKLLAAVLTLFLGTQAADAALLLYNLQGANSTKWTASFTFDTTRAASITLPNSVRYNGVPITFTRPNSTTVETVSFSNTGPTFNVLNNQGGFFLGFLGGFPTGFSVFGPQLFTGPTSNPTFLTGTFGLSDVSRNRTTDPLQVNYTLTVTDVSPVPEPATWGLMVLGFGALGCAVRRQRRPVLTAGMAA